MSRRRQWHPPARAFVGHPAVSRSERRALARIERRSRKRARREARVVARLSWRERLSLALRTVLFDVCVRLADLLVALYGPDTIRRLYGPDTIRRLGRS